MTICGCCNCILHPDWAREHSMCPVCWLKGCTTHHARHPPEECDCGDEKCDHVTWNDVLGRAERTYDLPDRDYNSVHETKSRS